MQSQSDVCQIRLDYDVHTIADPQTAAQAGTCSIDYFQGSNAATGGGTTAADTTLPLVHRSHGSHVFSVLQHCGENAGQHIFLDAARDTSSSASLTAVLTGTSSRVWKIKVTQVSNHLRIVSQYIARFCALPACLLAVTNTTQASPAQCAPSTSTPPARTTTSPASFTREHAETSVNRTRTPSLSLPFFLF